MTRPVRTIAVRVRRWLRESEAAFILLAATVGTAAGLATLAQGWLAHAMQRVLYGVTINRLSALTSIQHPWRLLALPFGGAILVLLGRWLARRASTLIGRRSTWWRPMRCTAGASPAATIW